MTTQDKNRQKKEKITALSLYRLFIQRRLPPICNLHSCAEICRPALQPVLWYNHRHPAVDAGDRLVCRCGENNKTGRPLKHIVNPCKVQFDFSWSAEQIFLLFPVLGPFKKSTGWDNASLFLHAFSEHGLFQNSLNPGVNDYPAAAKFWESPLI